MKTLAGWAVVWGVSESALKSFVRRNPEFAKLGTRIGPTLALSAAEANRIRAAFDRRKTAIKA